MTEIINFNVLTGTLLDKTVHTHRLQIDKPGALTLDFEHPAGISPGARIDLVILDPSGNIVMDQPYVTNGQFQVTLAAAGDYTVIIRDGSDPGSDAGIYALRSTLHVEANTIYDGAANNTEASAVAATLAAPIVGTLAVSDTDYFVVQAPASGQLNLYLAHPSGIGNSGGAVVLDVVNVVTRQSVMHEVMTGSELLRAELESGGIYSISLSSGYWSATDTGLYTVLSSLTNGAGNDFIAGTDADNTFKSSMGDDTLSGLGGRDTAVYEGKMASYQLTFSAAGIVVGSAATAEGTDTLFSIERLQFSDKTVEMGLDTPAAQVYRLYDAAFNRPSDEKGLGFWVSAAQSSSLDEIAQNFMQSAEFEAMYPATSSDRDNISKFYENVLDRPADNDGLDYWVQMREGGTSMSAILVAISESPEHQILLTGQMTHGVTYVQMA